MKIFLAFVCAAIFGFTIKKENINPYLHNPDMFSKVFNKYAQEFDTLLVYYTDIHHFYKIEAPYRIIAVKNDTWYLIDYYEKNGIEQSNRCKNCNNAFRKILNNNLLLLPDESELSYGCKKIKDTIVNGKPAIQVSDIELISDLEYYNLEYKVGKFKKKLSYRSPETALSICPDSKDRKSIQQIFSIIKQVAITPESSIVKNTN